MSDFVMTIILLASAIFAGLVLIYFLIKLSPVLLKDPDPLDDHFERIFKQMEDKKRKLKRSPYMVMKMAERERRVFDYCDQLKAEGKKISYRKVHYKCGGNYYITRGYVDKWRNHGR